MQLLGKTHTEMGQTQTHSTDGRLDQTTRETVPFVSRTRERRCFGTSWEMGIWCKGFRPTKVHLRTQLECFFWEPKQIFYIHIVLFMQTHTMHTFSTFLKQSYNTVLLAAAAQAVSMTGALQQYHTFIYQEITINHLPWVADDLDTAHTQWWHWYKVSDWTEDWRICKASCELERERERVSERQREKVRQKKTRIITKIHKEHTAKNIGQENDKGRKEKKRKRKSKKEIKKKRQGKSMGGKNEKTHADMLVWQCSSPGLWLVKTDSLDWMVFPQHDSPHWPTELPISPVSFSLSHWILHHMVF